MEPEILLYLGWRTNDKYKNIGTKSKRIGKKMTAPFKKPGTENKGSAVPTTKEETSWQSIIKKPPAAVPKKHMNKKASDSTRTVFILYILAQKFK